MNVKSSVLAVSAAAALVCVPALSQAQSIAPVDSFFVTAGVYKANNDIDMRWNPSHGNGHGSRISLEKDLGFDLDATEPFFSIGGSFGSHNQHQIKAFRYSHDGKSSYSLPDTYQIGNDDYVEGAKFRGDVDVDIIGVSYSWFFHRRRHSAFGIGLGAIRYDITASFAASALVNQNVKAVSDSVSEKAWVPEIHAEYACSFARRWRFSAELSYIKKPGGSISGDAVDFNAKITYFPLRHLGVALGYIYNDLDLDFDKSRFNGDLDIKTHGPQLTATYRF